jgi:plasmid stabilization system protein ParE
MKVDISEIAWNDILEIGLVIKRDNPARAGKFVDELYISCHKLGDLPYSAPLVPHHEATGIHRRVHGNYLIFYRIHQQAVEIIRVLHGAMDYRHLIVSDEE